MRNEIIKLLQGKGVAIGNDASNEEILSAAASLISPKSLPDSTPQHSTAPPQAAGSNPKINMLDPNANFDSWSKDQCNAFYSQELNDRMAKNGGDAIAAASVIRATYPKLFTRLEDIRRQLVGAQSAAIAPKPLPPLGNPSADNMDNFGMTGATADEFQIAFRANNSVYSPVNCDKIFHALVLNAMGAADLSSAAAAAQVALKFPILKARLGSQTTAARLGQTLPTTQHPFAVR